MHLTISREELLKPLAHVAAVVERRQTLPILSNVRVVARQRTLELTGTDLEVEVVAAAGLDAECEGTFTVPARKLHDICRALPGGASLEIKLEDGKALVQSGRSRFTLLTLPAADFPGVEPAGWEFSFTLPQGELKELLERTHFCMAHQDVRYYLNGLLLELIGRQLRAVATDGHRMGLSEVKLSEVAPIDRQVIVPRKGVHEITRFLSSIREPAQVRLGGNHVQVSIKGLILTSKLVDGRFPDYNQVMATSYQRVLRADRTALREALGRVAILANEKYRGVRFVIRPGNLVITAHNPEQEEAEEELPITYDGDELEVGFNVAYVSEAVAALEGEEVELAVNDANSSCVLRSPEHEATRYVVMPMRL